MTTKTIDITLIDSLQLRANGDNSTHVADLKGALSAGGILPPPKVVCVDGRYLCWDGNHTLAAHKSMGHDEIEVELHEGSKKDAKLLAAGSNATHGLKRSNADKRAAVKAILTDTEFYNCSNSKVAKICKVSSVFVAKTRTKLEENGEIQPSTETMTITRDGQTYTRRRNCRTVSGNTETADQTSAPQEQNLGTTDESDVSSQSHQETVTNPTALDEQNAPAAPETNQDTLNTEPESVTAAVSEINQVDPTTTETESSVICCVETVDTTYQEAQNSEATPEVPAESATRHGTPHPDLNNGLTDDVRALLHLWRELGPDEQDCFLRLIGEPVEVEQES